LPTSGIDKGVDFLQQLARRRQAFNYFRTPFGTNVELKSYPDGMAYEATAAVPLWNPRDNHP